MTGSSTVPAAVTRPFFDRGIAVGQIYGSTETAPTAVHIRCDAAADHPGSCGKASTTCEVRIVDDDGTDVEPGQSGELWIRGPNVLREYWRNPRATAEAITDGWFHTGDVGHVDDGGWMFIDDRKKDVIISGGENIYPAELENVLGDDPSLAESTVIGRADPRWGEVPIVVAVPAAGYEPDTDAGASPIRQPAGPLQTPQRHRLGGCPPPQRHGQGPETRSPSTPGLISRQGSSPSAPHTWILVGGVPHGFAESAEGLRPKRAPSRGRVATRRQRRATTPPHT